MSAIQLLLATNKLAIYSAISKLVLLVDRCSS